MKIAIQPVNTSTGQNWQVSLDRQRVLFHTETEAREFVSTLQRRITAPHTLPTQQRIAS
jgi:putative alpha-1,2-mannosidase